MGHLREWYLLRASPLKKHLKNRSTFPIINLSDTIVLSLTEDLERRRYVEGHFNDIGLISYRIFDAIPANSEAVRDAYLDGKVVGYPVCFRCHKDQCACANNILIPQQVANWLSFQAVWKNLSPDPDAYFLICEDDVTFHTHALELLEGFMACFVPHQKKVLIRLGTSGAEPFQNLVGRTLETKDAVVMSNASYILNGALAAELVALDPLIATTSDIWLHREMASKPDIQALTIDPLLATELSFNKTFAQFESRIHPKGITREDEAKKARHVMRVDSADTYASLRTTWLNPSQSEEEKSLSGALGN